MQSKLHLFPTQLFFYTFPAEISSFIDSSSERFS